MLLNNKHYYNLPPQERKDLWKHYKKVYPNMGYTDMVKHFNSEVENYQFGGRTDYFDSDVKKFADGGETNDNKNNAPYRQLSIPMEGYEPDPLFYNTLSKTETKKLNTKTNTKTNTQKSETSDLTKYLLNKYKNQNSQYTQPRYVAEPSTTSTAKSVIINQDLIQQSNLNKNKGTLKSIDKMPEQPLTREDVRKGIKFTTDVAGLLYPPAAIAGSAMDMYQGDKTGALLGLIPGTKDFLASKNMATKFATKAFNLGVPNKVVQPIKKGIREAGKYIKGSAEVVDAKDDIGKPIVETVKSKYKQGGLIKKYEDDGKIKKLDPLEEKEFLKEYSKYSKLTGMSPNPDDPEHYYDYRGLWKDTGTILYNLDKDQHLPSKYKTLGHPNKYIQGTDTTKEKYKNGGWLNNLPNNKFDMGGTIDEGESGDILPSWDKVKATLNPYNWGVNDYTKSGTRDQAFNAARKAGEKEFMWNNQRYNTRKDTDPIPYIGNNPNQQEYDTFMRKNYPEFFKTLNRGKNVGSITWKGHSDEQPNRASIDTKQTNSNINAGKNPETGHRFIANMIAESSHLKDPKLVDNIFNAYDWKTKFEHIRHGEKKYGISGTTEYDDHRLIEPGMAMIAYGNLSPNDIKKIQKNLGVKDDGYFGPDTYKAMQSKYASSPDIKNALLKHKLKYQDNDKNPIHFGDDIDLVKAYLQEIESEVPLKNNGRISSNLRAGKVYTDNALNNIIPGSGDYDVNKLQTTLVKKGYKLPKSTTKYKKLDGIWGDETEKALLDYQAKNAKSRLRNGGLANNIPKNRLEAESREEYKRMHPEIEAANFYNKIQKNINQTSEIYQSGPKKGQPTGKGALEPSYPEMMLMPGSLPIKAASKLGKAAVFAAEALNPIGGVKNLKPKGLTSSVNNTIRNTNSERIVYDLKNTDDYERYLRNNTNNQLPPPPSEIKFMPDGTTRDIYTQQAQPVMPIMLGGIDIRRPINGFLPGTSEWNRLNSLINKNRTQETYSTILRDLPREIHQRFDLRKYKNLNLNELTLKNPSLAEKIKLSLKNVYADVKKTANEANKKLGKSIDDKLYSTPNLEDVIESANKNLQKGMGVAKEKANITLKPFNKSTVDVYIDDVKTGSLELLPTTQTRSLSDILLGKSAQLPPFTKSKIAGLRKAGDFPFSSLSNEVAAQYKTKGISGEINKAISEALKAKKSRLYSGGTGHTNEGYLRYQNLLSKGLVKELQTNIYMYKKNGGLVK